jgi:hypothetical protein
MDDPIHDQWLADLHAPERLRYFSGRLLTAEDLQLEQDYWRRKIQLHNRFEIGRGVVWGLGVTTLSTTAGHGISVSPGFAIDAQGREIVVPTGVDLVPLRLSDDGERLPSSICISLCYSEEEGSPQLVSGLGLEVGTDPGPAGSVFETYQLRVESGAAPDVSTAASTEVLENLRSGRLQDALCLLAAKTFPPISAAPCVVLANIAVDEEGSLTVDACGPRIIAPTNRLLLQLAQIARELS